MYTIVTVPLEIAIILHLKDEETGEETVTLPQVENRGWFKCGLMIAESGILANV